MFLLISGIALIGFCVFACLPAGLDWGRDVLVFLKGCAPVLAAFIGLLAVQMGISDLRDKRDAKFDEKHAKEE